MKPNEEGIFYSTPHDAYHADQMHETPSFSASLAKYLISETPRHCWWNCARLNPNWTPKYKGIWDRGSAAHALILKSGAPIKVLDYADWRKDAAQAARDAARDEGLIPVLAKDHKELLEMRDALDEQLELLEGGNPFSEGHAEVTIRWLEEFSLHGKVYRIWCKSRLDWQNSESENLYDLKTSESAANPEKWTRFQMWDMGATYQASMYKRGIRRLTQLGILTQFDPDFLFLLVESKAPYSISLVSVPSDLTAPYSTETADERLTKAMVLWHDCLESNRWPGYDPHVFVAQPLRGRNAPRPEPSTAGASYHMESQEAPDEAFETVGAMLAKGKR